MKSEVDFSDIQGLVRFGYGGMVEATYALLRVKDAEAARAWLRAAPVTPATTMQPPPNTALQVAFTAEGLRALGISEAVLSQFSPEFLAGMTEKSRARRLGDVEGDAPENWDWGYEENTPHLLMMFFGAAGLLSDFVARLRNDEWRQAFAELRWLKTENLDGIEPFGFADGISQPQIDWPQSRDVATPQIDYTNIVALGEILLGYRNEYDKFTDRPLLEANGASAELLPAEDAPEKKDLGRNGTYLVMRQLDQDVRGFWKFIDRNSAGDAEEKAKLAQAMVGRTRDGDPLVALGDDPIPGIESDQRAKNQFTYEKDSAGIGCPFGAHVRRANPRNTDFPNRPTGLLSKLIAMFGFRSKGFRDDLMSSVRFHRILRRGREYGPELKPEHALNPPAAEEPSRGLHFICLNANISRQFEFLQNAWIVNTKFSGLTNESDPLLGNRRPLPGCPVTDNFSRPSADGLGRRTTGLPQFVTVRGGAYFFLPSLRALRYFCAASE